MKKIIIFGFPHCGTSILKSIIGHIDDVDEIINETKIINKKTNKKYILCKYPFLKKEFLTKQYEDYIKIFIIRNPLYVFSSLNERFEYNIPNNHSIDIYIKTLDKFIHYQNNPINNLYTIKYEDLFIDNYKNIKNILDKIGLIYDDSIFDNSKYINKIVDKPINTKHIKKRTDQINKPFINNNNKNKINLLQEQLNIINNNKKIKKLWDL